TGRRVDIGEMRSVRNRVQVHRLQQMPAKSANVGDIQDRLEADVALHTQAKVISSLRLTVHHHTRDRRRSQQACRIQQSSQGAIELDRVVLEWRVGLKGVSARRPNVTARYDRAIEKADAAANRSLAIAERIVGKAEPRPERGTEILNETFRHAFARLDEH